MTNRKKVYIAGKITGLDFEEAKAKFNLAEQKLTELGWDVISPIRHELPDDWPNKDPAQYSSNSSDSWSYFLKLGLKALLECDAIYLLDNYHTSRGALVEKCIAELTLMEIIYQ